MRHDPYLVLGIARDATHLELMAAHTRMALVFDPDRWMDTTPELAQQASAWTRIVRDAMTVILTERAACAIEAPAGITRARNGSPAPLGSVRAALEAG